MKIIYTLSITLLFALSLHARVINVTDHGIVPGQDSTLPLLQLIQKIQDETDITLVFPKGQYEFYPDNAYETYRSISNHDNSLKRITFPLFNINNLTIDGGNSLFMFHGRMVPFVMDQTDTVTLKNFSIDWDRSFHNELKIIERNETEKCFVAEIDPEKYPYTIRDRHIFFQFDGWEDPLGNNIVFDPDTHAPVYKDTLYRLLYKQGIYTEDLGGNRVKISGAMQSPPPVGTVLVTYGVNPTSRLCPAIHTSGSKNISVENVTVYAAGGMGFIAERTENIHLNGLKVTTRGDGERVVSTRADATHFVGCKGTIRIENCLLQHMLDDSVNVHGFYVKVEEVLDGNKFLCAISHPQQWGCTFAQAGDRVALLSRETVLPFFETTITDIQVLNEQRILISLAELPENLPDIPLSVENLTWNPDLIMRGNTVKENRARSVLVSTKGKVLIENNTFSSQMQGILIEGDNNYWYESGGVQDITIRSNLFQNIGFSGKGYYTLFASPRLTSEQHFGEGRYHRNITFSDNTVRSFNQRLVYAQSVEELTITGNVFEKSTDYPNEQEPAPAINLLYCDHVNIESNQTVGFSAPLTVRVSEDSEQVLVRRNTGLTAE